MEPSEVKASSEVTCIEAEDSDTTSDAGTDGLQAAEKADDSEGEITTYDVFHEEGVRSKISFLAAIVGMRECGEPGVVLAEVVRVLKELEQKRKLIGFGSSQQPERSNEKEWN